jgi:hypothetical protein
MLISFFFNLRIWSEIIFFQQKHKIPLLPIKIIVPFIFNANPFLFHSWQNGDRKMPILPQENKEKIPNSY